MNIYFDLDGVIRDIHKAVFGDEHIEDWHSKPESGKSFWVAIKEDMSVIETSPPTKYYEVISLYEPIKVISCQPMDWRPYTDKWMKKYLPSSSITYTDNADEKLGMLGEFDVLIEDYPLFSDYSKIILIDTTYNRNVTGARMRITEPIQLDYFLYSMGKNRGLSEMDMVIDLFEIKPWRSRL